VITVSLIGGLGNQMFQYAAGKALAERHGVELALDVSGFGNYALRSFLLDRLQVPEARPGRLERDAKTGKVANFAAARWRQRADRLLARMGLGRLPQAPNRYSEPHFHYDAAFETLGSDVALFGYFQSERYFAAIGDTLRALFQPREALGPAAQDMAARIEASALPISVHIRRGDYVQSTVTARVHGIMGKDYYHKALSLLRGSLGSESSIFVFSDDAAAAEEVLDFLPREQLTHVRGDPARPWEDMALMARCRHHVVANSSFSWWGAWLNPSEEKIVIAPRQWFTPGELRQRNTCDLCPSDWILI
jgi:hypothetical protein